MIKCHGNHNGRQEEGDHRPVWIGLTVNKPDIFDVCRVIGVMHNANNNNNNNNINNNYKSNYNHFLSLPMIRRDNFSSSDSLSLCRGSTPSCCMSCLGVTSTWTFSRPAVSNLLSLYPRDQYYRGTKIIIIIIIISDETISSDEQKWRWSL